MASKIKVDNRKINNARYRERVVRSVVEKFEERESIQLHRYFLRQIRPREKIEEVPALAESFIPKIYRVLPKIDFIKRFAMRTFYKFAREVVQQSRMNIITIQYAYVLAALAIFVPIIILLIALLPVPIFLKVVYLAVISMPILMIIYVVFQPYFFSSQFDTETYDIAMLLYSMSKTGLSPAQEFVVVYRILDLYRTTNLKYGHVLKDFASYRIFREIYTDIEYRHIDLIAILQNQLRKLRKGMMYTFFRRVVVGIRDGYDIESVLRETIEKLNNIEISRLKRSQNTLEFLAQMYDVALITVISMMYSIALPFSVFSGNVAFISSLYSVTSQSLVISLVISFITGYSISVIKSSYLWRNKYPVPEYTYLITVSGLMAFLIYLFVAPKTFFALVTIPIIITLFMRIGIRDIIKLRNLITEAEDQLPDYLEDFASNMAMGMQPAQAMISIAGAKREEDFNLLDFLFYRIGNVLKLGADFRDIFERFIIKIPSEVIRFALATIFLVEDYTYNLPKFIRNYASLLRDRMETVREIKNTISASLAEILMSSAFLSVSITLTNVLMIIMVLSLSISSATIGMGSHGTSTTGGIDISTVFGAGSYSEIDYARYERFMYLENLLRINADYFDIDNQTIFDKIYGQRIEIVRNSLPITQRIKGVPPELEQQVREESIKATEKVRSDLAPILMAILSVTILFNLILSMTLAIFTGLNNEATFPEYIYLMMKYYTMFTLINAPIIYILYNPMIILNYVKII